MTADRYLTPKDVAEQLQVSEKTLHRWASQDPTMPVLRLGGGKGERSQLRFPEDRLASWLRSREQGIGQPRAKKLALSEPAAPGQVRDLASVRVGDGTAAGEPWANRWAKKPTRKPEPAHG
jgi:hypothetical protein